MNDLISKSRLKKELSKIPSEMGLIKKAWVMQTVNKQKTYGGNNTCNCQHNSNSRDNEPCCRYDSKVSENDDTKNKVTSLEIIVRMIDNKPYYEIKYKKVDEDYYQVGYSSFNIDNVLKWRDECFELVDMKQTNADRIRNMSDEELAEFLTTVTSDVICGSSWDYDGWIKELQSEAE